MSISFGALTRPSAGTDVRQRSRHVALGFSLAAVGLTLAGVSLVNSLAAGELLGRDGSADLVASLGAWSFGLTTPPSARSSSPSG